MTFLRLHLLAVLAPLTLAACALHPVLTPYAVDAARTLPAADVATVWGVREGGRLFFTEVNGASTPSRGGGGYPVSLTLAPGRHKLRMFFATNDNRSTERSMDVAVEAGHTYVVEHLVIPGTQAVLFKLVDLGREQACAYEATDELRPRLTLRCAPRAPR